MVKFHYPTHPFVGIGVVVWQRAVVGTTLGAEKPRQQDRVLLVRRKNPPLAGHWGLPGGKQQLGETMIEAAQREVREETGIEITPLGIITALDSITRDDDAKIEYHYTIVEIVAEYESGEAHADDDALDVRWATLDEVNDLCSWPEVARVVRLSMLQRIL